MKADNLITLSEWATRRGKTLFAAYKQIERGRLPCAHKQSRYWMIDADTKWPEAERLDAQFPCPICRLPVEPEKAFMLKGGSWKYHKACVNDNPKDERLMLEKLSINIKNARKRTGLTQTQIAEKMGITQQTYARWETKKREPKLDTLRKIAEICGCEVFELLK
jgi:DNA-binding XRE family transcriptional regulator